MPETCECGLADECDGERAIYYPLQIGGTCFVEPCRKPTSTCEHGMLMQLFCERCAGKKRDEWTG